ncbi:hypothetical protein H1C71_003614, partial [Ictidomys tridecemlineatus]
VPQGFQRNRGNHRTLCSSTPEVGLAEGQSTQPQPHMRQYGLLSLLVHNNHIWKKFARYVSEDENNSLSRVQAIDRTRPKGDPQVEPSSREPKVTVNAKPPQETEGRLWRQTERWRQRDGNQARVNKMLQIGRTGSEMKRTFLSSSVAQK